MKKYPFLVLLLSVVLMFSCETSETINNSQAETFRFEEVVQSNRSTDIPYPNMWNDIFDIFEGISNDVVYFHNYDQLSITSSGITTYYELIQYDDETYHYTIIDEFTGSSVDWEEEIDFPDGPGQITICEFTTSGGANVHAYTTFAGCVFINVGGTTLSYGCGIVAYAAVSVFCSTAPLMF